MTPDPNTVHLRHATQCDLPRLAQVEVEAAKRFPPDVLPSQFATPMSADALAACLASALLWVAEDDAFGVVGFIAAEAHGRCLHIVEMDVLPSHGRQGIGARLLQQVRAAARDRRCVYITLTTFAHIPWNAPFYARQGFREVSEFGEFAHLQRALRIEQANGLSHRIAMAMEACLGG